MAKKRGARDIVPEGYQEHHVADVIVKELHALATDDEKWGAKFKVRRESVEPHIEEEERRCFVRRGRSWAAKISTISARA